MDELPRHSINWSVDEQWWWPAYRFGLKEEDLVGPLYQRFNTKALPVQSLECFHLDVRDIATAAPRGNVDALYAKLEERSHSGETSSPSAGLEWPGDGNAPRVLCGPRPVPRLFPVLARVLI